MKTIIVRYKTHPNQADKNAELIRAVFAQLAERAPKGLSYRSYRDGCSFVHVATVEGDNPLLALPAFQAFTKDIKSRCVEEPVVTEMSIVGSY
jgi:hypothetical protein